MQNKGAIKLFAILLALVSIYQLWFTVKTKSIESSAREFANGDFKKEQRYLDSLSDKPVYNFLFLRKYTYSECKDREINLGLDLKGGMNVTLEVSVDDVIRSLSNNSKDPSFIKAIALAKEREKTSQKDFTTLFGEAFKEINPNGKLASIFNTLELRERIKYNTSDEEVLKIIKKEAQDAIDNSFNIIRTRIDRFGVSQPNIQKLSTSGRILVELPGVKDPERVRKLLQGTASLEFWTTYENKEIYKYLEEADKKIKEIEDAKSDLNKGIEDSTKIDEKLLTDNIDTTKKATLIDELKKDSTKKDTSKVKNDFAKSNPLFNVLFPSVDRQTNQLNPGATVGMSLIRDTSKVNYYLNIPKIKALFPKDLKFLWAYKSLKNAQTVFELYAIKIISRDGKAPLEGDVITNARAEFGDNKSTAEVTMTMNGEGSKTWARLTKENIGKQIAVVVDNYVYSCPVVNQEINGGRSQITGNFTIAEAQDLANVLKSGKLPAPARIINEAVVGPSLGKESINAGLLSFVIAFIGVLLYMSLYYGRAGNVANIALFANVFFIFGAMASIGAVLTLPGIAGMVLTFAMAVDSNVIIYERMREEIRAMKGLRLVVRDGFAHAMSAIIDGHVTTILTGIVLYIFGTGPVQGFATTLIIGLILSLFSSIFIARLVFEAMLDRNMNITTGNKFTNNAFTKVNFDFIGMRKKLYIVSCIVIGIGIISLFVRGMSRGVDFTGGRTYIVRFDKDINTTDVRVSLGKVFDNSEPEVKTFGPDNQVKITTKYRIEDASIAADSIVESKLFDGVKQFYKTPITYTDFVSQGETKTIGKLSSEKVGPTIASDLIRKAFLAVIFGLLIIFIYITIRFRNWQFGLGGVISLFHDTMIVITMFSLFHGILPFSLDVDQHFIAAILTIIGYSIMDTVIIFDRIREYRLIHPKWTLKDNINGAINSTLGRTINTSGITIVVLIIIFIFGGEILRGFIFALLVGVLIGTYSSVFNATPIGYDLLNWSNKRKEKKELMNKNN